MSDAAIRILIQADQDQACRWAEMLAGDGMVVWQDAAEMPPHAQPEVILTGHGEPWEHRRGPCDVQPGVVRLDGTGQADAHLAADATPREIALACRLVAHIARLRNQVRFGQQIHDQLFRAALSDPITGLPNRRAWDEWLPGRLAESTTSAGRVCLAIVDLDHFKRVNDEFGHKLGDEVLRAAAKALHDGVRQTDLLARLGGDEFGLLVQVPSGTAAMALLDRVRRNIAAQPVVALGRPVTASAGFHLLPQSPTAETCPAALQEAADAALREAKRQGRDRVVGE